MAQEESKRQSIKTVDGASMAKGIYAAKFTNGTTFEADLRRIVPMYDELPAMAQRTLQYGIKQKLDDSIASSDDLEEAIEDMTSTWEAIVKGNWTMRVAGEGAEGGLFARAYSKRHELSLADAKVKIGGMVESNLEANRKRYANDAKALEKVTERSVINAIRNFALGRDASLKAIYDELKAKKAAKAGTRKGGVAIEVSVDE